jgi:hypothetical protein
MRAAVAGMLVVLAAPAGSLGAQVITPASRSVTGVVVDSVSGRPLDGAVLYFTGGAREHYAGRGGRFTIEDVGPADTLLVVRRIGSVPARVRVAFSPSAAVVDLGTITLRPVATELDRIAVEAEEVNRYPQLADFYRRKTSGHPGQFITREDVQRSGVRKPSEMLRRSEKVEIECPQDPVRSGDSCLARNRRGRDVRLTPGGWTFDRCEMDLYVDGQRSTLKVDEVPLEWIAAIEVYSGTATTPPAFGQSRCGVIAVWTTTGERREE